MQDDTPRIELAPKLPTIAPPPANANLGSSALDKLRGLRHRLPFFGRKRG
jgi:hypothetical protein